MPKSSLEIYAQTQEIAAVISSKFGFVISNTNLFEHDAENPRVSLCFRCACDIQELINHHEMSDVIDDYEENRNEGVDCDLESIHDLALKINSLFSVAKPKVDK